MAYIGRDIEQGLFTKQTFTADSSTTVFTLSHAVVSANNLLVSVGGVIQEPDSAYTASGTVLTFTGTPTTGDLIWVVYLGKSGSSSTTRGAIVKQTGVGDGTTTPITLSTSAVNSASIIVTLNGVVQVPDTDFVASGTTLTFTTAPSAALAILVYFLSAKARLGKPAAGSVTAATLASSGTLPAVNGSALTGVLSHADLNVLRTNISLAGFNRSTDHATTVLNMPNGFIDQFEDQTGVDDPSSTNELYDTTDDYYESTPISTVPMVVFDGTNDYLKDTTGMVPDGKEFTFSVAFKSNGDGAAQQIFTNTGNHFYVAKNANDTIAVLVRNSANGELGSVETTTETIKVADGVTMITVAVNLATLTIQIRIGTAAVAAQTVTQTITNGIIDMSVASFTIGSNTQFIDKLNGELGRFWLTNQYIDISDSTEFAKLVTSSGLPADVGADGSTPTGTAAIILLNNITATWQENQGSGANFTEVGALTDGTDIVLTRNNMTLISETSTASASPDNAHIALFNEEVDALTLDTDIMAWASRSKQTVTATNATNVLNATAHGLSNGDRVMLTGTATIPMVGFDGTNDYLTATNAVLGQSDGKNALISLWWDFTGTTDGSELHIIGLTNDKISIGREGAGNKIRVYLKNAANTVICRTDTTNTVTASDGLVHIAISIELGNTTAADRIQVWINGVKETMVAAIGPVDDTIDFTDSVFWLGAGTGPLYKCKGLLGQFYFAQEFLDLDVASNLEKVFVEYGIPVNMGSNGSAVTGTQPLIFLNNPLATWQENLGSGGNFTEVGDLYDGGELVGWHSQFGLSRETVYYVVNKTTNTFQVSATSGGSAVAFTDDVTGTHSVRVVTKAALVDRGDFETGKATLSALVDISGQPTDTDMSLIVQTKNNKGTKLHGMSMQYT